MFQIKVNCHIKFSNLSVNHNSFHIISYTHIHIHIIHIHIYIYIYTYISTVTRVPEKKGDMIMYYKIMTGKVKINRDELFTLNQHSTHGHRFKNQS